MTYQQLSQAKKRAAVEADARAAWGLFIGGVLGVIIGLATHHALFVIGGCACTGWIVGAFLDRARR